MRQTTLDAHPCASHWQWQRADGNGSRAQTANSCSSYIKQREYTTAQPACQCRTGLCASLKIIGDCTEKTARLATEAQRARGFLRRLSQKEPAPLGGFLHHNAIPGAPGESRTHNLRIRWTVAWNSGKQTISTYGLCSGGASENESVRRLWGCWVELSRPCLLQFVTREGPADCAMGPLSASHLRTTPDECALFPEKSLLVWQIVHGEGLKVTTTPTVR